MTREESIEGYVDLTIRCSACVAHAATTGEAVVPGSFFLTKSGLPNQVPEAEVFLLSKKIFEDCRCHTHIRRFDESIIVLNAR